MTPQLCNDAHVERGERVFCKMCGKPAHDNEHVEVYHRDTRPRQIVEGSHINYMRMAMYFEKPAQQN